MQQIGRRLLTFNPVATKSSQFSSTKRVLLALMKTVPAAEQ